MNKKVLKARAIFTKHFSELHITIILAGVPYHIIGWNILGLLLLARHHDTQNNDIRHNGLVCDTQHNSVMLSIIMLSDVFNLLLC